MAPPHKVLHRQIQAEARAEQLRGGSCLVEHAGLPHCPEAALGHSRRPHQVSVAAWSVADWRAPAPARGAPVRRLPEKACDSPRSLIVARWAWKMTKQVSGVARCGNVCRKAAGQIVQQLVGLPRAPQWASGTSGSSPQELSVVSWVSSVPASILTPPVLTTLASSSCHPRLCPHVIRPGSILTAVLMVVFSPRRRVVGPARPARARRVVRRPCIASPRRRRCSSPHRRISASSSPSPSPAVLPSSSRKQ